MAGKLSTIRSGLSQSSWPLMLLLVVAVAIPAACVLWFMTEAMRNEQMAMQGRLTAVYQSQLEALRQRLDDYWTKKEALLAAVDTETSAAEIFAKLVRAQIAESVVVYDNAGQVAYPMEPSSQNVDPSSLSPEWRRAWALEFQQQNYQSAANAYVSFVNHESTANEAALALRSQARCLVKVGQKLAALEILTKELAQQNYRNAIDDHGYLILLDSQLRALELIGTAKRAGYQRVLNALVDSLDDYGNASLPASQRRFLMQRLSQVVSNCPEFPTRQAEALAADYLDHRQTRAVSQDSGHLRHSGFNDVWELHVSNKLTAVVALFHAETITRELQSLIQTDLAVPDATVELVSLRGESPHVESFLTGPAGEYLPDWQLALRLDNPDLFGRAANSRIAMYLYSGVLVVLAMTGLAGLVARNVGRQIRVTRLRNDLIATVSHELKTPLSSIRALIETLLEGRFHDERQQRQYLQLAAKENERLSRLIDNFLAFSRMERNGETFEFADLAVEEIVSAAMDAVGERFEASESRLDVNVASGLPVLHGDAEALITVLVNLLDNALKYTKHDKQITLKVYPIDSQIRFDVEDNGVGLSRREAKKVFDRFHQVDQSLTRRVGGCGLGLSIVQFIVKAHGGSVGVSSQPGRGSTFSVTLPATEK